MFLNSRLHQSGRDTLLWMSFQNTDKRLKHCMFAGLWVGRTGGIHRSRFVGWISRGSPLEPPVSILSKKEPPVSLYCQSRNLQSVGNSLLNQKIIVHANIFKRHHFPRRCFSMQVVKY